MRTWTRYLIVLFLVTKLYPVCCMFDVYLPKEGRGHLAHIISGEVSVCTRESWVGVAYVYERNKIFYGYAYPTEDMRFIAYNYEYFPDTSQGSRYALSESDVRYFRDILGWELKGIHEVRCNPGKKIHFIKEVIP